MFGAGFAVADDEELVDVGGFALRTSFDDAFACIVVFVAHRVSVVGDGLDTVFFVPGDGAAGAILVVFPAGLVAVGVIGEGSFTDVRWRVRLGTIVGILPVVGRLLLVDQLTRGLADVVLLGFGYDVVDAVIAHVQLVLPLFIRLVVEGAFRMHETIKIVVFVGVMGGTP